ncbi:LuxR family transcriptional regulator [Herbiconiux sp. VKM Ac-2851]|uniref:helix-turn-helix transcriptional regulator n=1 Tax=Herbiconiux sp. VKM Ac-2851 TaxID=2739025 RepID=UPI001566D18B|nr:LuxR family transcriptional regulator [Herbiconiux sp. VKM Ac-2851]NQX35869.1 AAA family ATPase [Herbiconiux sp. VKM Ac-2851]
MSLKLASGFDARPLVGRAAEVRDLERVVIRSQPGGAAVLVEGDAGIGKSTLLAEIAGLAGDAGYRVLSCTGLELAPPVGYAALHQMLRPLLMHLTRLPARQREALSAAFGLEHGTSPDRLLVSVAALGLLEEASAAVPLFIAVEDLQWVDPSTRHVIEFLALRLGEPHVSLVATMRTPWGGQSGPGGLERLLLGPLDDAASRRLLGEVAPELGEARRMRVLREANGNPLALTELAIAVTGPVRRTGLRSVIPTTQRLEQAFLGQVAGIPERSQALMLLAAVADDAGMLDVLDAARLAGLDLRDLAPLETAGMLQVVEERPQFRHPLLRAAVLGAATTAELQRAHSVLAQTVRDPARAAWHRAASSFERSETVAQELEDAGSRAQQRGALAEAAAAYERAAELSESQESRAARLARAADVSRSAGLGVEALQAVEEAERIATRPETIALLATTRNGLSLTTGLTGHSPADIERTIARLGGPENADRRIEVLWAAAMTVRGRNLPAAEWRKVERQVRAIHTQNPLKPIVLALMSPLGRVDDDVRAALPQLIPELDQSPIGMLSLAIAAESLHDIETALTCWGLARERFHERGAPADEAQALRGKATLLMLRGRVREGLAEAEFAARMAKDTGQPLVEGMCVATIARGHATLGDAERTAESLRRLRELAAVHPLAMATADARWATGIVALAENRYRDALIELAQVTVHPTRGLWAIADRTEAAVRAGRADTVRDGVDAAEGAARAYRSAFLGSLVARSRALLADADGDAAAAEAHYASSIGLGEYSESPFEFARSELLFGEWLRRERRPVEAREHLGRALATFDSSGARVLAERSVAELRAAGEAPRRGEGGGSPLTGSSPLTPQELQVAVLAARGMSNKEIADRVYLSHRTVSTHLYKAFPKLGIASRAQLRDALEQGGHLR